MARKRELTAKARRFADAWNGLGTGPGAARAAGYQGDDETLRVTAHRLLRHPLVRARIEARLGAPPTAVEEGEPSAEGREDKPDPKTRQGRGTATERVRLLMDIGRDEKAPPFARIRAISEAAKIEGDHTAHKRTPVLPAPSKEPEPTASKPAERLAPVVVLSPRDQRAAGTSS